jgi:hypothetical protein
MCGGKYLRPRVKWKQRSRSVKSLLISITWHNQGSYDGGGKVIGTSYLDDLWFQFQT